MKIAVVSDTHGFFDTRLPELLPGAEAVLHAGDVGSQEVLDELRKLGPVHAVRGNVDPPDLNLPLSLKVQFESVQVEVLHQLPVPSTELQKWADGKLLGKVHPERLESFLKSFDPGTRVVVFGHSHQPCLLTLRHILFFNPGSAGKQRFSLPRVAGLLEIFARGVRGTCVSLERYNEKLPDKVWLPIGG